MPLVGIFLDIHLPSFTLVAAQSETNPSTNIREAWAQPWLHGKCFLSDLQTPHQKFRRLDFLTLSHLFLLECLNLQNAKHVGKGTHWVARLSEQQTTPNTGTGSASQGCWRKNKLGIPERGNQESDMILFRRVFNMLQPYKVVEFRQFSIMRSDDSKTLYLRKSLQ